MSPLPVVAAARSAFTSAYKQARKKTGIKPKFTGEAPSFLLYTGIGMVALLKDLLDWILIGSLPGLGTVVTICFNILIFLLFLLDSSGGRRKGNRVFARSLILILVTLVEGVGFGINFLPLEVLAVTALYLMARRAYKKEEKEHAAENAKKTKAERLAESRELIMMQSMQAEQAEAQAAEAEAMQQFASQADEETPLPASRARYALAGMNATRVARSSESRSGKRSQVAPALRKSVKMNQAEAARVA